MSRRLEVFFHPVDLLHVGPPSSSPMGEVHHTPTLFPPPANTWQGMIRTTILRNTPGLVPLTDPGGLDERERLVGQPERLPGGWQVEGPWPARLAEGGVEPWIPLPSFAGARVPEPAPTWAARGGGTLSHQPPGLWTSEQRHGGGGWIGPDRALELFAQGTAPTAWHGLPPFVTRTVRPGLQVDPEHGAAVEGLLYFQQCHRFEEGAGLYGVVRGPLASAIPDDALHRGVLYGGRKARPALPLKPPSPVEAWTRLLGGAHIDGERDDLWWVALTTPVPLDDDRRADPFRVEGLTVEAVRLTPDLVLGGQRQHGRGGRRTLGNQAWVGAGSSWLVRGPGAIVRDFHHAWKVGPLDLRRFGAGHTLVAPCTTLPPRGS